MRKITTDFAVYSLDEEKKVFKKKYHASLEYLGNLEFQNTRNFENIPPFFVPDAINSSFPGKSLVSLTDWKRKHYRQKDYTELCYLISENLIKALRKVHEKAVPYGCLSANNVLVDEDHEVWFSEWSFSSNGSFGSSHFFESNLLNYLAPEHINSNEIKLNHQSDLYSLGVIFYEIFTLSNPFQSDSELDTIYKHRTLVPKFPSDLKQDMGVGMSQLILFLLQKNPEARFSSMEDCHEMFLKAKALYQSKEFDQTLNFNLLEDHFLAFRKYLKSFYFTYSQQLASVYKTTLEQRMGSVCFVEGKNGVKKSDVINQFFNDLESENQLNFTVSLINDQQNPLASFRELLQYITQYYLTRPEDEIIIFRNIVQARVGNAVDILINVYPKFQQLIPNSKNVQKAEGFDLKNQLIFGLAEVLKSIIQAEKRVIIHFKGLQYATNNTFGILEGLLKELPLENLFFVFSYEESKLSDSQFKFKNKLLANSVNLLKAHKISIASLEKEELVSILEKVKVNPAQLQSIAEILMGKTGGLPSFLIRVIEDLRKEKGISFDPKTETLDVDKEILLSASNLSNDLGNFYKGQVGRLSAEAQLLLQLAAVFGDSFPKLTLKVAAADLSFDNCFDELLEQNLLKSLDGDVLFGFIEADFRSFLLENIDSKRADDYKVAIIDSLLSTYPDIENSEYLYVMLSKIISLENPEPYSKWLRKGLQIAQKIADFDVAFECSKILYDLLSEQDWENKQEEAFSISVNYMKACALSLNYAEVDKVYEQLKNRTANDAQFLLLSWQYVEAKMINNEYGLSLDTGIAALKTQNIKIQKEPSLPRIIYSSIKMDLILKGKKLDFFHQLPVITDQSILQKINIMQSLIGCIFIINPKMLPEAIFKQADYSIKNGFSPSLSVCIACYAFMAANFQQKYDLAESSYQLAEQVLELDKDPRLENVNRFLHVAFILPWIKPFNKVTGLLIDNFQFSRQAGDFNMAFYNLSYLAINSMYSEEKISIVKQKVDEVLPFFIVNSVEFGEDILLITLIFMQNIGPRDESYFSNFLEPNTREMLQKRLLKPDLKDDIIKLQYMQFEYYESYVDGTYEINRENVKYTKKMFESRGKGYYQLHIHDYYVSLCFVKLDRKLDRYETNFIKNSIKDLVKDIAVIPENFEAKANFLQGLWELKKENKEKGNMFLQRALELAVRDEQYLTAGFVARELGEMHEKDGLMNHSLNYFKMAIDHFLEIDAEKLADRLIEKYPKLKIEEKQTLNITQKIDLQSFINASNSISSEIKLENLLDKMMSILAENAGAETVYFIMINQQKFETVASKTQKGLKVGYSQSHAEVKVPESILQYVKRTKSYVLLGNASKSPIYKNDAYIKKNETLSVLCLPVLKNNEIIGILYFENNLTTNAFTEESTETLNLLAAQIAISYENSQLYENMEKKVLQRTSELMIEKDKSEKLLLNILPAEIADELKEFGKSEAKLYDKVTVLFTDFVGFTKVGERLSPKVLIGEVDEYFRAFDEVMEKYGLEKIKTIGDAYLAVCGLPNLVVDHAGNALRAAKEILDIVERMKKERIAKNHEYFDVRIGLNSGSVIAGIVGSKKFAYDIWGDTVNTAARMEQSCEPNKINLSESTYELVKDQFQFEYRGRILAKNKGEIAMYFLN